MKIETTYIGEVDYSEEDIISFPEGIPGFEDLKKYLLVGNLSPDFPFLWLQSTEVEDISFILTSPFLFKKGYDFVLEKNIVDKLDAKLPSELEIYSTVVVPENSKETTINLKSPIVINSKKKVGVQAVLDEDFPYKFKIFTKE